MTTRPYGESKEARAPRYGPGHTQRQGEGVRAGTIFSAQPLYGWETTPYEAHWLECEVSLSSL